MGTRTAARDTSVLAERLRLAMARLVRRTRQEAVGGEVTPSMTSALTAVVTLGAPTLGEIAAAGRGAAPTATKIVGRLEEAGLVVREQDAEDRRVVRGRLAAEGRRFVERTR